MSKSKELGEEYIGPMLDPNGSFTQYGLNKREYFAALAMQGLLSIYDDRNYLVPNNSNVKYMARLAVSAAEALLSELSNGDCQ